MAVVNPKVQYAIEHRIICPDGSVRWIFAEAITLRNAAGKTVRMVGLNMDITERKQAEEELRRSNAVIERVARTAGPLLRFSSLKWMPAASAARPMTPSSASISRTRCPLPIPPMAGLQDISPTVSSRWVSSSVRAPHRAAAAAASQPACPPPTTTTSHVSSCMGAI